MAKVIEKQSFKNSKQKQKANTSHLQVLLKVSWPRLHVTSPGQGRAQGKQARLSAGLALGCTRVTSQTVRAWRGKRKPSF